MKQRLLSLLVVLVVALLGAASVLAQEAEKPAAPEATPKTAKARPAKHSGGEAVKPETVSGTLSAVDADKKLVVVTDGNGIPFDFEVNSGTKITVSGSKSELGDLASNTNKQASVTFLAMKKRGNLAKSIEIQ